MILVKFASFYFGFVQTKMRFTQKKKQRNSFRKAQYFKYYLSNVTVKVQIIKY